MNLIDEILKETSDTKACRLGPGVTAQAAEMFRELFPSANRALVVDDVNTRRVAGERVVALLKQAGVEVLEHTVNPDGSWFHATYDKVEAVRELVLARPHGVAVAGFGNSYRTDGDFLRYICSQSLPGSVKPLAVMINGGVEPKGFQGLFKLVDQRELCGDSIRNGAAK